MIVEHVVFVAKCAEQGVGTPHTLLKSPLWHVCKDLWCLRTVLVYLKILLTPSSAPHLCWHQPGIGKLEAGPRGVGLAVRCVRKV